MSNSSAPLIIGGMVCCLLSVSAGVGGYLVYDHQQQCANIYANNYTSDATSNVGCTFNPSDSSSNTSTSNTSTSNTATVVVPADPDTFRPSTYSSAGGKCINTACRVSKGWPADCPAGFIGIGCSDPDDLPEACSQAGRNAGCVPISTSTTADADTFRPSTYSSAGGSCINTACRVTTGANKACPTGFKGIACTGFTPEACSQAGRNAGCVPI